LNGFNKNRKDLIKIKTSSDQTILLTNDEARDIIKEYIADDLDFFSSGISEEVKKKLDIKINTKISKFEASLLKHIDDKFNKVTETIIESILNHKIEAEVNKRLDAKLEKIKKAL